MLKLTGNREVKVMIYNNIEFHNAGELKQAEDGKGVKIYRYPLEVREYLEGAGKREAESCRGCELRFVTDAEEIQLYVTPEEDGDILVFKGNYFHSRHMVNSEKQSIIELKEPERFSWVKEDILDCSSFSPKVWRIFLDMKFIKSIRVDTKGKFVRAPKLVELPKLRWLAYGSSITYGVGAINNLNCYVQQTARRLGADVINLGLSGSCYCEEQAADFIAQSEDWDFVTLEVGVNMRACYSKEEFEKRANYLIDSITYNHPKKPVLLINILPNHAIFSRNGSIYEKDHIAFSRILEEIVEKKKQPRLYLISGEELLKDFSGLTVDLIHPSDAGHIQIGENLANNLVKILELPLC
jgi:lysophospholipase L1-like esterase